MKKKATSYWLSTSEAAKRLGYSISTLDRRRWDGTLKQGTHYLLVGSPKAKRPTYRWHIKKCADALGIPLDD